MKTKKIRFALYSLVVFSSLLLASVICGFTHVGFALLSYFISFVGIIVTLIVFIIGFFLDRKEKKSESEHFNSKKIIKKLISMSIVLITTSIIYTSIFIYNENIYETELENQYIGMNKQELLLELRKIATNECPVGRFGHSIIVSKNMSEKMILDKSWDWDCNKVNTKHGWRSYKFIFNDNMIVEKVIITRVPEM